MNEWLEILQFLPMSGIFLNFDERADLAAVADLTAVSVDERKDFHVFAELDVI